MTKFECEHCTILYINGVRTHEEECPRAHQETRRYCRECGCAFVMENISDIFCPDCQRIEDDDGSTEWIPVHDNWTQIVKPERG